MEKHFGRNSEDRHGLRSEAVYSIRERSPKKEAAFMVEDAEEFLTKAKEVVA